MVMVVLASALAAVGAVLVVQGGWTFVAAVVRSFRRGRSADPPSGDDASSALGFVLPLVHALAEQLPSRSASQPRIEHLLRQAGAPNHIGPSDVRAGAWLSAAAFLVLGVAVTKGVLDLPFLLGILMGVGGYFLPQLWLRSYASDRIADLQRQLPYMIDLVVMSMEAGSSFV